MMAIDRPIYNREGKKIVLGLYRIVVIRRSHNISQLTFACAGALARAGFVTTRL